MCIQLIKRYKLKYKIYNNEIEISNNEIEISNDEIELKTLYCYYLNFKSLF